MFWGVSHAWHWLPRAFSLFLQMHTLHIDTYMDVHQWSLMTDQRDPWGFSREEKEREYYYHTIFWNYKTNAECCGGGTNPLHLFTTTHYTLQYYREESVWQRGIFINAALIHHSQLSRLFLSIKFKSHSFLLPLTLRLSTSLHSSIFLFLSLSLWFWSVWWSSIDPTVLTAVKRVAIGYHLLLFRHTSHHLLS